MARLTGLRDITDQIEEALLRGRHSIYDVTNGVERRLRKEDLGSDWEIIKSAPPPTGDDWEIIDERFNNGGHVGNSALKKENTMTKISYGGFGNVGGEYKYGAPTGRNNGSFTDIMDRLNDGAKRNPAQHWGNAAGNAASSYFGDKGGQIANDIVKNIANWGGNQIKQRSGGRSAGESIGRWIGGMFGHPNNGGSIGKRIGSWFGFAEGGAVDRNGMSRMLNPYVYPGLMGNNQRPRATNLTNSLGNNQRPRPTKGPGPTDEQVAQLFGSFKRPPVNRTCGQPGLYRPDGSYRWDTLKRHPDAGAGGQSAPRSPYDMGYPLPPKGGAMSGQAFHRNPNLLKKEIAYPNAFRKGGHVSCGSGGSKTDAFIKCMKGHN